MATTKETIKTMLDIQLEPVTPTTEFITHAGTVNRQTADHAEWEKDLEHRRDRAAEFAAKRPAKGEVNIIEELDSALVALEAGAQDFEQTHGKANELLISAKPEVDRLRK
jgi:hypothetical protein